MSLHTIFTGRRFPLFTIFAHRIERGGVVKVLDEGYFYPNSDIWVDFILCRINGDYDIAISGGKKTMCLCCRKWSSQRKALEYTNVFWKYSLRCLLAKFQVTSIHQIWTYLFPKAQLIWRACSHCKYNWRYGRIDIAIYDFLCVAIYVYTYYCDLFVTNFKCCSYHSQ